MADEEAPQQVLMVTAPPSEAVGGEGDGGEADNGSVLIVTHEDEIPKQVEELEQTHEEMVVLDSAPGTAPAPADILQQAFQEATEFELPTTAAVTVTTTTTEVEYDSVESAVAEVHGEPTEEEVVAETTPMVEEVLEPPLPQVEEEVDSSGSSKPMEQDVVEQEVVTTTDEVATKEVVEDNDVTMLPNPVVKTSVSRGGSGGGSSGSGSSNSTVRLLSAVAHPKATKVNAQAPIGSSQNPIQIIQQGNTYHSTQVLSQEQLQQIAQVLQQQQQLSQLNPNGGTSVLYNAATNTRIVYRIIYPSDGQNKTSSSTPKSTVLQTPLPIQPKTPTTTGSGRGRGRPRKQWGKRNEEPEERAESPDMSREEKEEKKKHRPRTRSGRISKPPKVSADEDDENSRSSTSSLSGASLKRRNRCKTCNKMYVGRGGLARHYRMNPTHGNPDELETGVNGTSLDAVSSVNENQASNDATALSSPKPSPTTQSSTITPGPPRRRGRPPANHELAALRRKAKLKEVIDASDTNELMEVMLPTLAKAVSVWEFLLMKCEQEPSTKTNVASVCKELDQLLKQAQKMAQEFLFAVPECQPKSGGEYLQINDTKFAGALGITTGLYEIKNEKVRCKFSSAEPKEVPRKQAENQKVTVEPPVTRASEPPPSKRARLETSPAAEVEVQDDDASADQDGQFIQSEPMLLDFEGVTKTLTAKEPSKVPASDVVTTSTETVTSRAEVSTEGTNCDREKLIETVVQATTSVMSLPQVKRSEVLHTVMAPGHSIISRSNAAAAVTTSDTVVQLAPSKVKLEIKTEDETVQLVASEGNSSETMSIVQSSQVANQMQLVCAENELTAVEGESEAIIRIAENGTPQFITPEGHVLMQDVDGQPILGQVICQSNDDGEVIRQVVIQDGQILTSGQLEGVTELSELTSQTMLPSNVVILQNPDGTATALQLPEGENGLPLETFQALISMDPETRAQILSTQTELTE